MAKRRDKGEERGIAVRRIDALLAAARLERTAGAPGSPRAAEAAARTALRIAQTYQTGLSRAQKVQVCRKCGALRTSATTRVRLRGGRIATTCLACGWTWRLPLAPAPAAPPRPSPGERGGRGGKAAR